MMPTRVLLLICSLFMLAACAAPEPDRLQGFTLLQDSRTSLNSASACDSLQRLQSTGANSLVLVPFMEQPDSNSTGLERSDRVTDLEIRTAALKARALGLHIILKPQILIPDSWPGDISFRHQRNEKRWFRIYEQHMQHYAQLAQSIGADALVIGTELRRLRNSPWWPDVIATARKNFSGQLTYAAHNLDGAGRFPHWDSLDAIGVTLYPALPLNQGLTRVRSITDHATARLARMGHELGKPAWILEIGIPSARGWARHPWDWRALETDTPDPDPWMQRQILSQWMTSIDKTDIAGIWFWQWDSTPDAGGFSDTGYTVQNKPAEGAIRARWQTGNQGARTCQS